MKLHREIVVSKSGKTRNEHYWLNDQCIAKREGVNNKGADKLTRQEAVDRSGTIDDQKVITKVLDELFALDQGCFWPAPGGVTAWEEFNLNWLVGAIEEERAKEAAQAERAEAEARVAEELAAAKAISDAETLEWLQSQAWRKNCDTNKVIGVHYPGGGDGYKGSGEHVSVCVGNGRTFNLKNISSGDRISTAFEVISEVDRTFEGKKVVQARMHDMQANQFARYVQLSDAAGNHRALDPLVERQVNAPTPKMIGKWGQQVDTSNSAWSELKQFCKGKSEMSDNELIKVFRLFNQCARR
jgi:hypothetical protein